MMQEANINRSYDINQQIIEAKNKSIRKKPISYKTYVKRVKTIAISSALATILSFSVISNVTTNINDAINKSSVNTSINNMVAEEKRGGDLLSKYSYIVDYSKGTYAYDTNNLSKRVIKVDPQYFDLVIYNVYSYMEYKNNNLDEFFKDINFNLENIKETNPEVYYKMKDVDSFESYLRKLKFINEDGSISIEKYESYGNTLNELYKDIIKEESKGMSI